VRGMHLSALIKHVARKRNSSLFSIEAKQKYVHFVWNVEQSGKGELTSEE